VALNDWILPDFFRKSTMTGTLPIMSITENKIRDTEAISLKLNSIATQFLRKAIES